jgi:hypothetical protein
MQQISPKAFKQKIFYHFLVNTDYFFEKRVSHDALLHCENVIHLLPKPVMGARTLICYQLAGVAFCSNVSMLIAGGLLFSV